MNYLGNFLGSRECNILICASLTLEELLYPQYTECIHTGHFDRVFTQRLILLSERFLIKLLLMLQIDRDI